MIPWYYAVATFFLGGFAMLMVWGFCMAMGKPTPKPERADRRKGAVGRWTHPERRQHGG